MRADSSAVPCVVVWATDAVRRPLIASILEVAGLTALQPGAPEEALQLLEACPGSVLVLDANVSRPSSTEFLRHVGRRLGQRRAPILALIQPGQASLRAIAEDLGVSAFLTEPFAPEALRAGVGRLLPQPSSGGIRAEDGSGRR